MPWMHWLRCRGILRGIVYHKYTCTKHLARGLVTATSHDGSWLHMYTHHRHIDTTKQTNEQTFKHIHLKWSCCYLHVLDA